MSTASDIRAAQRNKPDLAIVRNDVEQLCGDPTDAGNADWFAGHSGKDAFYMHDECSWYRYDGSAWRKDRRGEVRIMVENDVRAMLAAAAELEDKSAAQKLSKHATKSLSNHKIKAMLSMAEAKLAATRDEFDRDPLLLGVKNGVVDLRTGEHRPALREDRLSRTSPVAYDKAARADRFASFLSRIVDGNESMLDFIQRAVGYSCTALTNEQCFFLCYGAGANGKSTLLNIIGHLLGDYHKSTPNETLLQRNGDRATNDLARLAGARFVTASEPEDNRKLAAGLIKQLTGQDAVTARFHFQEFDSYHPGFKLWLSANHKPAVTDTSHGMWRRVRLIPFTATIPEAERDEHLSDKLLEELPGILNWAIAGALSWQQIGLAPPAPVLAATEAYRRESDTIAQFIDERCELGSNFTETFAALFDAYGRWAEAQNSERFSKRGFGLKLDAHGLVLRKTMTARLRLGVKLRATDDA